jgi:hypothetical protein
MTRRREVDPYTITVHQPTTAPTDKRQYNVDLIASVAVTDPEVIKAARMTVCGASVDAKEARKLMAMLGIEPGAEA